MIPSSIAAEGLHHQDLLWFFLLHLSFFQFHENLHVNSHPLCSMALAQVCELIESLGTQLS